MSTDTSLSAFHWTPQPAAEALIRELVEAFLQRSEFAARLGQRMLDEAGVRFMDMLDHLRVEQSEELDARLRQAGFQSPAASRAVPQDADEILYTHEAGIFPRVLLADRASGMRLGIKVESVADFESVWQTGAEVSGAPLAPLRTACLWSAGGDELWAVERHGQPEFSSAPAAPPAEAVLRHADRLRRRSRQGAEAAGFATAEKLIAAAIAELGVDYACDLFFFQERDFWQRRNLAAQAQRARQDRLGLGWANHDHHTYRSSRGYFARMIGIFEMLGFHCRERFYAGHEAGWGAQVLEQPRAGVIIFADVDLSPDELAADFAHESLTERDRLGTVGLWCALHGESFLSAGMHHLECQFDFAALERQLASQAGVKVMKPFTDFPYLKQAFTEGERWAVDPRRIASLLDAGRITPEQAAAFAREGAIGSHLENLERNAGFKGFNQTGVSEIIAATDPRKHLH